MESTFHYLYFYYEVFNAQALLHGLKVIISFCVIIIIIIVQTMIINLQNLMKNKNI